MNTVKKGNRRQRQAANYLLSEGWLVYVARRGFKGQDIDLFNLFDIIAYKDEKFLLIQVKSNHCSGEVRQNIEAFKTDNIIVRREIWVYKDYDKKSPYIESIK